MAPFKIPILFLINSRTFWYIERLPTSSYAGVTYFQKWSGFFGPPCIYRCMSTISMDPLVTYLEAKTSKHCCLHDKSWKRKQIHNYLQCFGRVVLKEPVIKRQASLFRYSSFRLAVLSFTLGHHTTAA